ncbi:hypothetical protein SRABI98_02753 [Microbacterium sp. Bi98]|uniref:ATP-binding cassette domain-containing protein n=1 Tax=Microbacterium sp. Bi98 TaxID=2821116 RepID=UPI001DA11020|nr:ABC transporter ATP-binding protein [Microbacterium sp. Bi98]CAH0231331.1 hypothetical protein SRABI98_02753 [Microbacterium sp. Bi98]
MSNGLDAFNAKRMTADQVAGSFVVPAEFDRLSGNDHVYVIGPRGSGKTTLLRMLTGETLRAWEGSEAEAARRRIDYTSIFVPADELWASQASSGNIRVAFAGQLLLAAIDAMTYRVSGNLGVHLPASLSLSSEIALTNHFARLWGLGEVLGGFKGLQAGLELLLLELPRQDLGDHALAAPDSLRLLVPALEAFNREVEQRGHRWALLLDEMELAPPAVHAMVTRFVRGGPPILTLKISMSPFDRFMQIYGEEALPAPGNDFDTIYLSGRPVRELRAFTNGLWRSALKARGLQHRELSAALDDRAPTPRDRPAADRSGVGFVRSMANRDPELRQWLRRRQVNLSDASSMSYSERSATIRKITPLLVYRDALLNFRDGQPVKRSRKKSFEPFTGANAIATILEGNPRWIKSAFAQMLERYDARTQSISAGFQLDSLTSVADRFEALLRVLPTRQGDGEAMAPLQLVDTIARYLRDRNLGPFTADAPNSFVVDHGTPDEVRRALLLCLYAGAIVHLRSRNSPAVLSSFTNERFRLTYLLSVRDGKELPLRLGKDVRLTSVLEVPRSRLRSRPHEQGTALPLEWSDYEGA